MKLSSTLRKMCDDNIDFLQGSEQLLMWQFFHSVLNWKFVSGGVNQITHGYEAVLSQEPYGDGFYSLSAGYMSVTCSTLCICALKSCQQPSISCHLVVMRH
jgi:hypothetical protein